MILVGLRTGAPTKKCGWEGERVALSPLAGPAAMSAGLALLLLVTSSHRGRELIARYNSQMKQSFTTCLSAILLITACESPQGESGPEQDQGSRTLMQRADEMVVGTKKMSLEDAGYESLENSSDMNKLFDFTSSVDFKPWRTVDDRVMGGVSRSRMMAQKRFASFQGELSVENNGGFASVRSPELKDELKDVDAIRLKVRGDGRDYQLSIRTDRTGGGVRYRTSFPTEPGAWTEVLLPLEKFRPTWRGRSVPGAPQLAAEDVRSFGFMVSDKQVGQFRLDVESLIAE